MLAEPLVGSLLPHVRPEQDHVGRMRGDTLPNLRFTHLHGWRLLQSLLTSTAINKRKTHVTSC